MEPQLNETIKDVASVVATVLDKNLEDLDSNALSAIEICWVTLDYSFSFSA